MDIALQTLVSESCQNTPDMKFFLQANQSSFSFSHSNVENALKVLRLHDEV